MVQQLLACDALAEDLSWVPGIYTRQLTTTCDSSSMGMEALGFQSSLHSHVVVDGGQEGC